MCSYFTGVQPVLATGFAIVCILHWMSDLLILVYSDKEGVGLIIVYQSLYTDFSRLFR